MPARYSSFNAVENYASIIKLKPNTSIKFTCCFKLCAFATTIFALQNWLFDELEYYLALISTIDLTHFSYYCPAKHGQAQHTGQET